MDSKNTHRHVFQKQHYLSLALAATLAACSTISPFNQQAYQQATELKAESLVLMSKATEPYSNHLKEIQAVQVSLEKNYEYAKGRPLNQISTEQWMILKNPEGHSLGGFLVLWGKRKTLNDLFVQEAKKSIAGQFDQVIELESGKQRK
jgi:hypothetical protein